MRIIVFPNTDSFPTPETHSPKRRFFPSRSADSSLYLPEKNRLYWNCRALKRCKAPDIQPYREENDVQNVGQIMERQSSDQKTWSRAMLITPCQEPLWYSRRWMKSAMNLILAARSGWIPTSKIFSSMIKPGLPATVLSNLLILIIWKSK